MTDDVLARVRGLNPVPQELKPPPLQPLLNRIDALPPGAAPPPAPRRPRRPSGGTVIAVACGLIAVAVVAVALGTLKRHGTRSGPPVARHATTIPGRQQLIDTLAPLRRSQTADDRRILATLPPGRVLLGVVDRSLVRHAATTPWGERVYLVPFRPFTKAQLRHTIAAHKPGALSLLREHETVGVYSGGGSGGGRSTAASIAAGQLWVSEGAGRSFAGGSTHMRSILVVPDGVAKVAFVVGRQPDGTGSPTYRHSLTITVPVHGNVAAAEIPRETEAPPPTIWYGTDGRVIKRIGNLAAVNRVRPAPTPGPETAQSRAAERDPSTPNRVWVTPTVGGPHTTFKLHFRVLLSDADYRYRLTGTRCPAITPSGGGGGGTNDLRGRIWGDTLDAVSGQTWCPGTYRLTVAVSDLGRRGELRHPAKPFGAATFTVRR